MCLGESINFSIKIVSSLNALAASPWASKKFLSRDASSLTTRIPLPPPPAAAFSITGKPIFLANDFISLTSSVLISAPSITGTLALRAIFFAAILSPSCSITSDLGPTKIIPSFSHLLANPTFSDKKPYPG